MNRDSSIGRMMSLDEAITFYERCMEAENHLGSPLTHEERLHLLNGLKLGKDVTLEDYQDMMSSRKALILRSNEKT